MTILPPPARTSHPTSREDFGADTPPLAEVRPHPVASPHGVRVDPFYWMRDDERRNPRVRAYLEAENDYKERHFKGGLREVLYAEIIARLKPDDASVPYFKDGYWYYTRFETGKEHPVFARRKASLDAPEEIVLDGNERAARGRAAGQEFYQIGAAEVSPNGEWLAFCEDFVGRRQYELRFRNLRTQEVFEDPIANVESEVAWANDNATVLYVEKDPETLLGLYVKKHVLGADPALDAILFTQTDMSFYTGVAKSKSERFIFISMESTVSSEWRYADASDPALAFKIFLPHERDHEYQIEHLGEHFIVRTNWRANNFRLMQSRIDAAPDRSGWEELVGHREDTFIQDFDVFERFIALSVRSGGLQKISIQPLGRRCRGGRPAILRRERRARVLDGPQQEPTARHGGPALQLRLVDDADDGLRLQRSHRRAAVAQAGSCPRGFRPASYATEFIFVSARDGRRIPGLPGVPPGIPARRHRASPAVRLRRLRPVDGPLFFFGAIEPARPGLRVRHRPRPRRAGDGTSVV